MRAVLRIGEVARLLGVTPKTVRHYHKLGLLAEPARSAAGYRLYGADDLLRLHQIRRLQALGLSLAWVKEVLGRPGDARSLRDVLGALREELSGQIAALEVRRDRVERLLAGGGDALDALDRPVSPPPMLELIGRRLGERLPEASATLWEQEARLWATLDPFAWPAEYAAGWRELVDHLAARPDQLQQLHALGERFAALTDLPADAPAVVRVAEEWARYVRAHPLPPALSAGAPEPASPFGPVIGDLLGTALAPAQRRCLELARRCLPQRGEEEGEGQ